MGARKNLLLRKHTLVSASFIASMLLFVSSAYALNNTSTSVDANDSNNSETEFEHSEYLGNEMTVSESTQEDISKDIAGDGTIGDGYAFEANEPVRPIKPIPPQNVQDIHVEIETEEITEGGPSSDYDHISIAGTEVSNDSNVRLRIRNSSSTEINDDEVDSGNGSFTLRISENASTH